MSPRNSRSKTRSRRSRSPLRKSLSPPPRRRGIAPGRRSPLRDRDRDGKRMPVKRTRSDSRNRNRSPPLRRLSRDRSQPYSSGSATERRRGSSLVVSTNSREELGDRFHGSDRYNVDRPVFRGPEKDVLHDRDELKKIVVMRSIPLGNDSMKRNVINPEDITVVRREAGSDVSLDYCDLDDSFTPESAEHWSPHRRIEEETVRPESEGSRPIFERDEILNHKGKYEDDDRDRRRGASPTRSERRHSESHESYRQHYEETRNPRSRNYQRVTSKDHESRTYDKGRDERSRIDSRYPSSSARSRSYDRREHHYDRKFEERDSHSSYRRSPVRRRTADRSFRRHLSPEGRRRQNDYEKLDGRRNRSAERRDVEYGEDVSSGFDYHGGRLYESEGRVILPPGGRGRGVGAFRGVGLPHAPGRPFPRAELIMCPVPAVRPIRTGFIPRAPPAARLPFSPRLVGPIVRPVIRYMAPVIRVRPPQIHLPY